MVVSTVLHTIRQTINKFREFCSAKSILWYVTVCVCVYMSSIADTSSLTSNPDSLFTSLPQAWWYYERIAFVEYSVPSWNNKRITHCHCTYNYVNTQETWTTQLQSLSILYRCHWLYFFTLPFLHLHLPSISFFPFAAIRFVTKCSLSYRIVFWPFLWEISHQIPNIYIHK